MIFRTKIELPAYPFRLRADDGLFFLGSCFAGNIGGKLKNAGLPCVVNPFGPSYNPASLCRTLETIDRALPLAPEETVERGGERYSLLHHTLVHAPDAALLAGRIDAETRSLQKKLHESRFLFLTFGTAWAYEYLPTGTIVNNCHKLPASSFRRFMLSPEEIVERFERLDCLKGKKTILTVSPIRHLKDSLAGNSLSKAVLRVAAEKLCRKYGDISYFPAFEIMTDDLRDYRFYDRDMVHPSETAVDYIFEIFGRSFFSEGLETYLGRFAKLERAASHRPFAPESESYRIFLEKLEEDIRKFGEDYPFADLDSLRQFFPVPSGKCTVSATPASSG